MDGITMSPPISGVSSVFKKHQLNAAHKKY